MDGRHSPSAQKSSNRTTFISTAYSNTEDPLLEAFLLGRVNERTPSVARLVVLLPIGWIGKDLRTKEILRLQSFLRFNLGLEKSCSKQRNGS